MNPPDCVIEEEEYLVREPEAEYKSEFIDGRVVAMSGASLAHSRIVSNVLAEINQQLKGTPCQALTSDTRVKVAAARFYTYPDLSVVCEAPLVDAKDKCAILNPVLIVEVLSPSTEAYDRGQKFGYYKKLDSLQEYVLVAQDRICLERFTRQKDGRWASIECTSLGGTVDLPSVGCRIALRDVYDKVKLGA